MSVSEGGKKAKVEEKGVVNMKGGAAKKGDDEFTDFTFKEGSTNVLKMQDIFIQEKGKEALKKVTEQHETAQAAPKVKGGAKGKKKAASKAAAKERAAGKKSVESSTAAAAGDIQKKVSKVLKYTPSKSAGKKETTPQKGKVSAKRSVAGGKKQTPAMPSPGGKKSTKTTDLMTMNQFKKYLEWHEKKKKVGGAGAGAGAGGKASSSTGKVLGKRSAGKTSTASGKSTSKSGKRQAK